jgi:uncharacterized protein (DUF305 family)
VRRKRRLLTIGTATLAAALALVGCANSSNNQSKSTSATTSQPGVPAHNQADVTFAQGLLPHHQLGVQNCDIILGKQGIDPRVIDLAKQMKDQQTSQIQQLQDWLKQWGGPATPSQTGTSTATPAEIADLQNTQGVDDSKMFLAEMISHHQAAIAMAQTEIQSGQFPAATAMAHDIVNNQQQQIDSMQQILSSL